MTSTASNVIDYDDAVHRNMYGVTDCPKCSSTYRFAFAKDLMIQCNDCGFAEQGVLAERESE